MSSSVPRRRETIHISLGSTANAVSAHWLNLEGLAVATDVCCPWVTHDVDPTHGVWVPRVLFVDQAHRMMTTTQQSTANATNNTATTSSNNLPNPSSLLAGTSSSIAWDGVVQEFSVDQLNSLSFDPSSTTTHASEFGVVSNYSGSHNSNSHTTPAPWVSSWHQTATQLAYAPYSSYRCHEPSQYDNYSVQSHGAPQQQQGRHVNWDDLGDEPDDEQDEYDREEAVRLQEQQQRRQEQQWRGERQQLEDQLSSFWTGTHLPPAPVDSTEASDKASAGAKCEEMQMEDLLELQHLSWMDFWMPPHPSPLQSSLFSLPTGSASFPLHVYQVSDRSKHELFDDLWEKLRHQLERTDTCQGFTVATEHSGLYAGMTNWLLLELQNECKSADRWVFHVNDQDGDYQYDSTDSENAGDVAKAQARVRNHIQRGLTMAGLAEPAHVVVPLQTLPDQSSLFASTASLAMALETVTLPYRCRISSNASANSQPIDALVGWNSRSGYEEGRVPTEPLSLAEYRSTLQPSSRYALMELDTVHLTNQKGTRLSAAFVEGTSVERDHRMRQPRGFRGSSTAEPGAWMLDADHASNQGLLASFFPKQTSKVSALLQQRQRDRSVQYHFGLSTCLRRSSISTDNSITSNEQYLTCLMEGMGIRYRPESSLGMVLNQSLTKLTGHGQRHGAGSYWKYLLGDEGGGGGGTTAGADDAFGAFASILAAKQEQPVVSVLGNTTRVFPYLQEVAKETKSALTSSKTKGFYQREVSNGTLPEIDDCDEALEFCLDLRDAYEPPYGSGLGDDGDEALFDD